MQVKGGTQEGKLFQFPKVQRAPDGERHFNEQTLKLLLKKKKEDLRLSKPLVFPNQLALEANEETEPTEDFFRVLTDVSTALKFSNRLFGMKTTFSAGPNLNSISMLTKDKDHVILPPDEDSNR